MIARATFTGPRIQLTIQKANTPSIIIVRLNEHGDEHPISGFPRVLVKQEEMSKPRTQENMESRDLNPRIARARRRRSRMMRSNDTNEIHSAGTSPRPTPQLSRVAEDARSISSAPELSSDSSHRLSTPQPPSISELAGVPAPRPTRLFPEPPGPPTDWQEDLDMERAMELSRQEALLKRSPTDELKDFHDTLRRSLLEQ